jgi:RNA polymerase sigma factor (sigma-70 family)
MDVAREALVLGHMEHADKTAWTTINRLLRASRPGRLRRAGLVLEDLHSAAKLGLVKAASRFKFDGPASFKTYSEYAIKGAIIDELDRHERMRRRGLGHGGGRLELVSLDQEMEKEHDASGSSHRDHHMPEGWTGAEDSPREFYLDMVETMKRLPERERYVLMMLAAGYKLRDLAPELGVTIMRVSQIATEARKKVREATA